MVTEQEVEAIGRTLVDPKQPLQTRFRALFTLRGLGGPGAISWISQAFSDDSALLKHELAYCLGQMQDARAIPVLVDVLRDTRQEPMVRHEAGEWPGHRDPEVLELLKEYSTDPVVEVTQPATGGQRLEWLQQHAGSGDRLPPWTSPPARTRRGALRAVLLTSPALFEASALPERDGGLPPAGLRCGMGYVLGQLQHEAAVPHLAAALARPAESPWCGRVRRGPGRIARPACLACCGPRELRVALTCTRTRTPRPSQYATLEQLAAPPA
uniref:Deoxyhypusine hydroxylase n=1 Tax=Microcebus murinus TaxID=30608 RepID=A0A8C5YCF7_MICMU